MSGKFLAGCCSWLVMVMSCLVATSAVAADNPTKILWSEHGGSATIVAKESVNTDHAVVAFRFEADDYAEDCARNASNVESSDEIAKCVKEGLTTGGGKIYLRGANCPKAEIWTEFGGFVLVNFNKNPFPGQSQSGKMIQTNWKDIKSGEIIGNSSAAGTYAIIDTYRTLCPVDFNKKFEGYHVF
jgi:hypothetical protein